MREPYYIDTLIDRLLFPPASMTVGNLQKLHSECAEMLLLFRNTPSSADAIREAVEAEREACAKLAEGTVCDVHLPTGIKIYGQVAARAIRARGAA